MDAEVYNFILLLLGAIFFALAVPVRPEPGALARWNLIALGLLCWVLVPLIAAMRALG